MAYFHKDIRKKNWVKLIKSLKSIESIELIGLIGLLNQVSKKFTTCAFFRYYFSSICIEVPSSTSFFLDVYYEKINSVFKRFIKKC